MKKTLVTAFTIGSLALSTVGVAAAHPNKTLFPIQGQQLSKAERQEARVQELADLLGISAEQVTADLKAGKKPLQIAEERGISKDQLKQKIEAKHQAMLEKIKAALAAEVQSGKITQAQMDARLKTISAHAGKHQGWNRRHFGAGKVKIKKHANPLVPAANNS